MRHQLRRGTRKRSFRGRLHARAPSVSKSQHSPCSAVRCISITNLVTSSLFGVIFSWMTGGGCRSPSAGLSRCTCRVPRASPRLRTLTAPSYLPGGCHASRDRSPAVAWTAS